jgi:ribosome modulation factor
MRDDLLTTATMVVAVCREEGREARAHGAAASDCPYPAAQELERSGWLDGWSKPTQGQLMLAEYHRRLGAALPKREFRCERKPE